MPVSHIGLTVSHLPASSSFFLSALQPLGYRYIGQQGHQVGFGIREADFFLCQETPGIKAGAAHIAFTATSRTAVREFYSAALIAGGKPNGSPACRTDDDSHFNAAVLDFDGNSIEVVYSGKPDYRDDGTVISHSRVITWERTVSQSMRDDASVISSRTARSVARAPTEVSKAPSAASKAPSVVSQAPSVARSISEPVAVPQAASPAASSSGDAAKTLVGTLLGAAAGAAVAYAFVRSERDSAKKEADFSAFMEAKNTVKAAVGHLAQASPPPQPPMQDPPPTYEPAPSVARSVPSVHRNDDAGSVVSASPSRASQAPSVRGQKQIEAAPASYYAPAPSHVSLSRSQTAEPLQIEYAPARSVAGSDMRSRFSASRSMTSPEMRTIEAARSVASVSTAKPQSVAPSRAPSVAHSTAPSSLISSFVPDHVSRKPEGSVYSHHSSRSKAKSSHTHASKHSSHSKHTSSRSKVEDSFPSPPPPASEAPSKRPSKAASVISSILGRDKKSSADSDFIDDLEIEELTEDDYETVVPSDSISQAGSSRRTHRRKHRSRTDELKVEAGTTVSKSSRHSESSRHSHRSHRSHKSRSHHDDSDSDHSTESRRKHRSSRPTVVSELSDASTIRPAKPSSSSRDKERRKDSVTEGSKYDDLFDQVQYGRGSVPVRGITPSMINAATNNKNRSVISFALGQKMKAFEGQQ
ncbi:hypothetical protein BU25DRAFT_414424 [Macroventuria anomochaeta]|uniref:Uncharacterized protein n=1 Tax=Macroventuria anomochaeta TaxID=301207 RepID=A0ACB6RR60_9PLEO|nr:uncharacterized protein BU25DRAFT_414424 [Macroventuria anomochaeta]KAF2623422.1 hypothetical protein BU25DRAFT_414424 [Macroventuria anomochaeta]